MEEKKVSTDLQISGATYTAKVILGVLKDLAILLCVLLVLFLLFFRVVIVSGPSMLDTLWDGDCLLLLSSTFYTEPAVGDIIVASKQSFHDGEPIVKRIIATEGQVVDIDFDAGVVYVDSVPLEESYTLTETNLQEGVTFPLTVEDGCVFVMGDNRNRSQDSRSKDIGLIDVRQIVGKAIFLIFPGSNHGARELDFGRIGVVQ